jgi:ATP synthase protein I
MTPSSADRDHPLSPRAELEREITKKQQRKLAARREGERSAWFGLGMFGLVGWSVALPTLLGIALGIWIDETWPSRFSWTLMLLTLGVGLGCLNAWWWIQREGREPD